MRARAHRAIAHLRAQWMGGLALFLVIAGGTAYAANTVSSSDIVNNQVYSADVRNDSLDGGGLSGADIREQTLGVVQGRGTLLSNRMVSVPGQPPRTLLEIPGLGTLEGRCVENGAWIDLENTTNSTIDEWVESNGASSAVLMPPSLQEPILFSDLAPVATLGLGLGNDPGPRRIATVQLFAFQSANNQPCGFQAQGTLWTSG